MMPLISKVLLCLTLTSSSCDGFGLAPMKHLHVGVNKSVMVVSRSSIHQHSLSYTDGLLQPIRSSVMKHDRGELYAPTLHRRRRVLLSAESSDNEDDVVDDDEHEEEELDEETNIIPSSPQSESKQSTSSSSATITLQSTQSQRPDWALPWMPTSLVTLRPAYQFIIGLLLYIFHLRILTQHGITFPFQLIPNDEGWFQSIGLDSIAGMLAFAGLVWLRKASVAHADSSGAKVAIPPIWSDPTEKEAPWKLLPKKKKTGADATTSQQPHPRTTSVVAFMLLTVAYFSTGRFSLLFENGLYAAAGYGFPLTVAMHRSLVVLLGHLTWVLVGSGILAGVLSPKPFFGGGWATKKVNTSNSKKEKTLRPYRWYTNKWDTYWLWWTIGGYFVSAWLFNIADFMNQILLPPQLFAQQAEGVVSQLINPENLDFLASLVGYIAPCLSAPWWEEVLYRGYLLPALRLFMGFWPSVFVSGVLFSVHHLSVMGAIPLAVLGWTWAALYAKSGNILVTMLIHGMWNSRVFLGSWFGLIAW
eukprot:g910.t1 g910   contig10:987040-988629(+)